MPFFSSLLGQICWREGPWTTAWYVFLLLQNLFRMQFSTHLLRFGSSWQNKASAPKRTEKQGSENQRNQGILDISACHCRVLGPGAVERCVTPAWQIHPSLAADSWRFLFSWHFCDQRKEKVDLSHISHTPASTKERRKPKTGPSLQEEFLGEKKSVWDNIE